jgi:hypothetical protein
LEWWAAVKEKLRRESQKGKEGREKEEKES